MTEIYTKLIRYKLQSENCPENARLAQALSAEIASKIPDGFGYIVFDCGGGEFIHVAASRKAGMREALHALPTPN